MDSHAERATVPLTGVRGLGVNPEIELLRALSILFVLVMHAPLLCIPFPAGAIEGVQRWIHPATGVDVFFVISGYLMGRSFVGPFEAAEEAGRAALIARAAAFWTRRFYRLMPASALWIGITFVACVIARKPRLWLAPDVMFVKSIASLIAVRNFEESAHPSSFGYFWSLSVENQFYLALPLLLLVVRRRWRVPGMLGLCALNAIWRPGGEQLWWLFRYDGLIYGLLLFELERSGLAAPFARLLPRSAPGRAVLLLSGAAVVLVAPLAVINDHPLAWAIVCWGAAVLVFAAAQRQGAITVPGFARGALLWLGARSYSLYLCHIPIWFAVIDVSERVGWARPGLIWVRFAVALPLSLLAAGATYRWVELPMQERGRRRTEILKTVAVFG